METDWDEACSTVGQEDRMILKVRNGCFGRGVCGRRKRGEGRKDRKRRKRTYKTTEDFTKIVKKTHKMLYIENSSKLILR